MEAGILRLAGILEEISSRLREYYTNPECAVKRARKDTNIPSGDPAFYLHHAQVDRLWTLW